MFSTTSEGVDGPHSGAGRKAGGRPQGRPTLAGLPKAKVASFDDLAPSPSKMIANMNPTTLAGLGALLGVALGQAAPGLGFKIPPSPARDGAIGAALALGLQRVLEVHELQQDATNRPEVQFADPRPYL